MEFSNVLTKSNAKTAAKAGVLLTAFVVLCGFRTECVERERLIWKGVSYERSCEFNEREPVRKRPTTQQVAFVYYKDGVVVKSPRAARQIARLFDRLPNVVEDISYASRRGIDPDGSDGPDASDSRDGGQT